jgi:hypothetical protein
MGADVKDVPNPGAGGGDVHSLLGACAVRRLARRGLAPIAAMGVPLSLTRKGALSA